MVINHVQVSERIPVYDRYPLQEQTDPREQQSLPVEAI
jgi:hypothetical protein